MPILHRDFETRSFADLERVGAARYAADPTTEVLVICFAVDDGPIESFIPSKEKAIPQVFYEAANNQKWYVSAHNDAFESAIEKYVLKPRYRWPLVPAERHICSMAVAQYRGFPGALEDVADILELSIRKDKEGKALMQRLAKPQRNPDGTLYFIDPTPKELERLTAYCANDVGAEREAMRKLDPLPPDEQRLWCLDRTINKRGVAVDVELAGKAGELAQAEKANINTRLNLITNGAVTAYTKVNDIRKFVNSYGHNMTGLDKRAVAQVLASDLDADVREVLELRQAGANSAAAKYAAVLAGVFPNGRVYGLLHYHGARTGRWTSARFNIHNLPRQNADDAQAVIAAIQSGDLEQVRAIGHPLNVIAAAVRSLIVAPPGRLLLAGDFSTIEPRICSWFAGERWKLENFCEFDKTGDPLRDNYRVLGAHMLGRPVDPNDKEARQRGKTVTMAFNYGAGPRVWRNHVPNDPRSDEEIRTYEVKRYRLLHPAQTRFMYDLDKQALYCVRTREPVVRERHSFIMDGNTLLLRLPSGRVLSYPRAHIKLGKYGEVVAYRGAKGDKDADGMWYGAWLAHLVQATARDILVNALLKLDAAGFEIILHVHDEAVAEIDADKVDAELFKRCMLDAPSWADGLPLAAEVRTGTRYIKTADDAPIVKRVSAEIATEIPPADVEIEADAIEPEIEIAPDEDESEITPDEVTPEEADEIKIEAEEIEPASLSDSSEPVRVCVHCQLQPPDGLERTSSYAGAWLHPRCEAAFISARMAEEGLSEFAQTQPSPPPSPQAEAPNGRGSDAEPAADAPPAVRPNGQGEVTNAEFIAAIFTNLPEGAFAAVCAKSGDPDVGGWSCRRADQAAHSLVVENNNYLGCSSFYPGDDGSFKARKAQFAACHFLMLDDLGTKAPRERLDGFELSWLIETSPGNHQGGIILAEPITEGAVAVRLLNAVIGAGLCDPGATGPLSRWARLPVAINGKPKYADKAGVPFQCRLIEWRPSKRYSPEEIVDRLQLELAPAGRPKKSATSGARDAQAPHDTGGLEAGEILTPKAEENPVVAALKARGLYKTPLGSGKHNVTCPWVHEHTDALDTGAAYFEPDELYPLGGFCCLHSHRDKYHIRALLEFLGVRNAEARHKPVIRVVAGDLHRVVSAAEKELANRGRHYQAGGLIVSVVTDPTSGDPSMLPISAPALARELAAIATWEKYNARARDWVRCDPPVRHVGVLFDAQSFRDLPPLAGLARQPYFRESDGELVKQPGYDKTAQRFSVFDPRQFVIPDEPTPDAARAALAKLEELLVEFRFAATTDKAAALAAIFTGTVRPSLPHAPAFHVRAPVFGSGKSYLCELIGAFTGPGKNSKMSYPATSEEATKAILAALLTSPACVEFDDMDTDWLPHGAIKRMLTAEAITDRILGVNKTATVSTRTLFLGSGNNVGPLRDLLRRVLTIHIDPRCEVPSTLTYTGAPVERMQKYRSAYVAAVLTIIQAWRKAGSPRTQVDNIVTFGGAWSDYCRHPLMWLGYPDPATALLEQVRHDPDSDILSGLMIEWHAAFGSVPTTIRKAINAAALLYPDLLNAIREFPVVEKRTGEIDRNLLGWMLKKHADRIVRGFKFQRAEADGRAAWQVVAV